MAGRFRDIEHVIRVALLFVIGFGTFVAVRSWLVPDDFGVYGFYRAGALDDARARPVVYAGRGTCGDCHPDVVESRKGSRHEGIGCESCHGALAAHAAGESEEPPIRPDQRATCIRCHAAKAGKPAGFPQVDVADHAPDGPCTACHQPHHPGVQ